MIRQCTYYDIVSRTIRSYSLISVPSVIAATIYANKPLFIRGNILQLPFRRTLTVSLSDAITQYISSKYDQRPDMFADDLLILDRLRSEAVNVQEAHVSGVSRLVTYAAQLKWLGGKFPVDVRIYCLHWVF